MTKPSPSISAKNARRGAVSLKSSRWTAYATAGAATALVGAATNTAEADIHHVNVNALFNAPASTSSTPSVGVYNLAPGGQFTVAQFLHSDGVNGHALFGIFAGAGAGHTAAFVGYTTAAFGSGYVSRLAAGNNIPAHANFVQQGQYFDYLGAHADRGQFVTPGIGFAGFRFNIGNGIQYGWARFNMNGGPGNSFTLVDYAWGDVGDTITAGQTASVPEPGSLGLLALGGAGLIAWRKRRAAQVAKDA